MHRASEFKTLAFMHSYAGFYDRIKRMAIEHTFKPGVPFNSQKWQLFENW